MEGKCLWFHGLLTNSVIDGNSPPEQGVHLAVSTLERLVLSGHWIASGTRQKREDNMYKVPHSINLPLRNVNVRLSRTHVAWVVRHLFPHTAELLQWTKVTQESGQASHDMLDDTEVPNMKQSGFVKIPPTSTGGSSLKMVFLGLSCLRSKQFSTTVNRGRGWSVH